ncbi:hypothetical protein JVT61DRAFT_1328 [Boletus reticuloceps]|uniref:Uncharacterized protein n=1 Tax=Boletus reticuloceps TaxID=495285 RepID=A0A8I2YSB2_9AGAM|nr:hypothetical protein JVT61DRAFT_1328 [Boletus reticuloceps]
MVSPTTSSGNGKTNQPFSLSLTIYSHVKKGKGKTKEEKTTKMKELMQCISDAIDVDDAADYNEMVKKIIEEKPSIVRVLVNKHIIEKALRAKHARSGSKSVCSISESNNPKSRTGKANQLDARLVRLREKLQTKYGNEHNGSLIYNGPLGSFPLTPIMILDWRHAMVSTVSYIGTM